MELVCFRPCPDTEAQVEGWLHTPITEMVVPAGAVPHRGGVPRRRVRNGLPAGGGPGGPAVFARGYNVFLLTYSVGEKARDFRPLRELSETVAALRERPEWHCDRSASRCAGSPPGGIWRPHWAPCGMTRSF